MRRNLPKKIKPKLLENSCRLTNEELQQHLLMQNKFKDYYCPRKSENPIINLVLIITFLSKPEVKAFYSRFKKPPQYKDKFVMVDEDGYFLL
jgi:hypothetical protein